MLPQELQDKPLAAALEEFDSAALAGGSFDRNELVLVIEPSKIVAVCRFLREKHNFNRVSTITCVDWYPREPRFDVVYMLHSIQRNQRVRLKCQVSGENPSIESVTSVWTGANWYEREIFDLFGVAFVNHPNLTRILMPEGWKGHPLRKDYPIHGYKYSYKDSE